MTSKVVSSVTINPMDGVYSNVTHHGVSCYKNANVQLLQE